MTQHLQPEPISVATCPEVRTFTTGFGFLELEAVIAPSPNTQTGPEACPPLSQWEP